MKKDKDQINTATNDTDKKYQVSSEKLKKQ